MQSILNQGHQDYEVIMVDDGSTDASGIICDKYVERDSGFTVLHTDNKGICAARSIDTVYIE